MSTNPRDTQFAGFAEKLYQEIQAVAGSYAVYPGADEIKRIERGIIARRAYDFVAHVLHSNEKLQWRPLEDISVSDIPDLTEWPEEGA